MKFTPEFKEAISHLSSKEKDKLILRLLKKDLVLANRLHFELVNTNSIDTEREKIEQRIIERSKNIGDSFYSMGYLNMDVRYLSGEITEHVQVTRDKFGEASLNILLLIETLKNNKHHIEGASLAKSRKFCVAVIARCFKILLLIDNLDSDYLIEFEENLKKLGILIGDIDVLMKIAIHHGFDVNWFISATIPDDIVSYHKELRQRGYLK